MVCRDASFEITEGEIVALIGANGAGKSTTLRAIAGALLPRAGSIRFRAPTSPVLPSYARTNLGIALVPEGRQCLSVSDGAREPQIGGFKYRRDTTKVRSLMEEIFVMFPRLRERAAQCCTLSGGEQQMLVLGRAMMSEPRLLCLDEPSLGLAPMVVQDIFRTIRAICRWGDVFYW